MTMVNSGFIGLKLEVPGLQTRRINMGRTKVVNQYFLSYSFLCFPDGSFLLLFIVIAAILYLALVRETYIYHV